MHQAKYHSRASLLQATVRYFTLLALLAYLYPRRSTPSSVLFNDADGADSVFTMCFHRPIAMGKYVGYYSITMEYYQPDRLLLCRQPAAHSPPCSFLSPQARMKLKSGKSCDDVKHLDAWINQSPGIKVS